MLSWPSFTSVGFLTILCGIGIQPAAAQERQDEYDDVDPWTGFEESVAGPDSTAVARILGAMGAADPLVCQLAVRGLGNSWNNRGGDRETGRLAGETLDGAQDAITVEARALDDPAAHLVHPGEHLFVA